MRRSNLHPLLLLALGGALSLLTILNFLVSFHWQQRQNPIYGFRDGQNLVNSKEWAEASTFNTSSYRRRSLSEIAGSDQALSCSDGLIARQDNNIRLPSGTRQSPPFTKIPRIIHQTSKSRCLAKSIFKLTERWQFDDWEYYLHDDEAIERLFAQEAVHFPLLPQISRHCLVHGTLKADLWRYLVLWVYGGIYTDLDTAPNAFVPDSTISPQDDALFVVEQYHMLSQYFMAVTPRHPLMWYAIQRALQNLWDLADTGKVGAAMVTGPHTLHRAFIDFRYDAGFRTDPAGVGYKPVSAGHYVGSLNYTVAVIGVGENQNEYIHRDLLGMQKKTVAYEKMNMRHFQQDKKFPTGRSCLSTLLEQSYMPPK